MPALNHVFLLGGAKTPEGCALACTSGFCFVCARIYMRKNSHAHMHAHMRMHMHVHTHTHTHTHTSKHAVMLLQVQSRPHLRQPPTQDLLRLSPLSRPTPMFLKRLYTLSTARSMWYTTVGVGSTQMILDAPAPLHTPMPDPGQGIAL